MRAYFSIKPLEEFSFSEFNQYHLVGLVWNLIKNAGYSHYHKNTKYRPFSFSELFPFGDFKPTQKKHFIIASPDSMLIEELERKFKKDVKKRIGRHPIEIKCDKTFELPVKKRWITASPLALRMENGTYWRRGKTTINDFSKRLNENVKNTYEYFTGKKIKKTLLFSRVSLLKEVAIKLKTKNREILVIGAKWHIDLAEDWKEREYLYKFLMDCGLGERTGLGFGFVNPGENK